MSKKCDVAFNEILSAVFQECLENGRRNFNCQGGHVIKIHSVEAGFISEDYFNYNHQCSPDHIEYWELIDQALLAKCNRQQQCHFTSEEHGYLTEYSDYSDAIKITYNCITDDMRGLLL